jgi:hypothetical protein
MADEPACHAHRYADAAGRAGDCAAAPAWRTRTAAIALSLATSAIDIAVIGSAATGIVAIGVVAAP